MRGETPARRRAGVARAASGRTGVTRAGVARRAGATGAPGAAVSRRPARPVRVRVPTDPRFSRRRRAVEHMRRRRLAWRAGAGVAALAALWAVFFSPLLDVSEVRVSGATRTGPAEVVRAAGLDGDENVLLVSTAAIAARVERLPWVRSADVDRMLPGTIRVRVVERKPRLTLSLGAARWTIDAHGRVLGAGEVEAGLPVLAGIQIGTVQPGIQLRTAEARHALAVWRALPRAIRRDVVGVFAPSVERITLSLADDLQVRYGAAERLAAKNEVLKVVLRRARAAPAPVTYVDVRVPSAPAMSGAPPR
jgi:cell division protein FtsQ